MIKSPVQWAKSFNTLAASADICVDVQLTTSQLRELAIMMEQLSLHVDIDKLKEVVDIEGSEQLG